MNKLLKRLVISILGIYVLLNGTIFAADINSQYFDCVKDLQFKVMSILNKFKNSPTYSSINLYSIASKIQNICKTKYIEPTDDKYTTYELDQKSENKYNVINPNNQNNDVLSLITIKSKEDVEKKRTNLINYIWGSGVSLSFKVPFDIQKDVKDETTKIFQIKSADKITVLMDNDIKSIVYHFHPSNWNNKVVLFHQWHEPGINWWIVHAHEIQYFLDKWFSVIVFSMPLNWTNNNPIVNIKNIWKVRMVFHDQMPYLDNFIKYYLEPIYVTLNYITQYYSYSSINMVWISWWWWTTTLYSAIDPRITNSFPVAWSYPFELRYLSTADLGDSEQWWPDLYKIANYYDLYLMWSYWTWRQQVQILNQYDDCCFWGLRYKNYDSVLTNYATQLGAKFKVVLDSTHKNHKISDYALDFISGEISK